MYNALKARLFQGYRTGSFPDAPPSLPDRFTGRPVISAACTGCGSCQEVCPVEAVEIRDGKAVVDTGKCIFCRKCAEVCPPTALQFSQEYRMAAMEREKLLSAGEIYEPQRPTDREFLRFCGKSLKIRQVSAGGCAACELDFNVLGTLAWDMGRFGIQVVASPRHADCILVTGPVSRNMLLALRKSYDAAPHPGWVIACGACAISGGIYADSTETCGGVEEILKPDLYIPGCPPHPTTILEGLLRLMGRK
jgi:Ni,Fe-hydrogenase III small subunit/ferredoxin